MFDRRRRNAGEFCLHRSKPTPPPRGTLRARLSETSADRGATREFSMRPFEAADPRRFVRNAHLRKSTSMTAAAPEFTRSLCAALTLSERSSALRRQQTHGSPQEMADVRARDALSKWKSQPPFTIGDNFEKRLDTAGLTEEEFLTILGLPATHYS